MPLYLSPLDWEAAETYAARQLGEAAWTDRDAYKTAVYLVAVRLAFLVVRREDLL